MACAHLIQKLMPQHFRNQLASAQFLREMFAYFLPIPQNRDAVRNFINLVKKMSNQDNADALLFERTYHIKENANFVLIEACCRLIENQYFCRHINTPGNCNKL